MSTKILIIDDSKDFRSLLRLFLNKELQDVEIEEYDFDTLGRPADNFDWSSYDVLLLDYKLGPDEDGLQWLKDFGKKAGFPPTVILTAEGDEYVAVKAVKLGAADYINKKDVTPKRLAEIVEEAIEYTPTKQAEEQKEINDATHIIQKIHQASQTSAEGRIALTGLKVGYKFVRLIGKGAMSQVYLAERLEDQLTLVLKVLDLRKVSSPVLIDRFNQEAELIAHVNSPFVVKIYDHGLTDDYGFIAMEFFSRGDLKQRMELGLSPEIATIYMTHIVYGLDAIHKNGVIHRDLKPANIMFRGDDSLAIADFGISKKMNDANDLTTIGQILGTPHYMSPEQGEGKVVDTRADLYSAGILYYELLTNQKPFTANSPSAMIYQHVHAEIPQLEGKLSIYNPIIQRLLAKNPDDRYQTAEELIQVLANVEKGIS